MIRDIRLRNGSGSTFDLMRRESFFNGIEGFGFTDGTQFEKIGDAYYPLEQTFNQGKVSGSILFAGESPYKTYYDFAGFIRNTPLELIYETDAGYSILPVVVSEIGKTELSDGGHSMECPVKFTATGRFYRQVSAESATELVGGKTYGVSAYPYAYAVVMGNTLEIDSDSFDDSPCAVNIYGPCVNPVWKQYVNGELTSNGRYEGTIPAGHRLVISSITVPYTITERGSGGEFVADRYQFCDFSTDRFLFLQHGANRISVTHDGLGEVQVIVTGRLSYATL